MTWVRAMGLAVALLTFGISPAEAATPSTPTGVKVSTTATAAKITWPATRYATSYRVCLRTAIGVKSCVRLSTKSSTRSRTFKNLTPTTGTDYFAIVTAYRGSTSRSSTPKGFDLPPNRVPSMTATGWTPSSLTLTWRRARNADGYLLQLATSPDFRTGLMNFGTTANGRTLTGLSSGRVYYFRVRARNGNKIGVYSPRFQRRIASLPIDMNIVTYNLCGQNHCFNSLKGSSPAFGKWTSRKAYAARLALKSKPDFIATQESGTDTNFGSALPGYALAYRKSAKSLFYNSSRYTKILSGWVTLRVVSNESDRYAVWGTFLDKKTFTRFVIFDAHLTSGKGMANDALREKETRVLRAANTKYNPYGYPAVFAGDFNSNRDNANQSKYPGGYDAPMKVFTAAGIADTKALAATRIHDNFNSYNGAEPVGTRRNGQHLDLIFATGGRHATTINVAEWEVIVDLLSDGQTYVTPFASDHNLVRAKLTIPGFPSRG